MPIKPIDLQTLFMQMGQVGRQHAMEKDGILARQLLQEVAAEQKALEDAKSVHLSEDDEFSAEGVKNNEEKKASPGDGGTQKRANKEQGNKDTEETKEVIKDPELGGHIDLTG